MNKNWKAATLAVQAGYEPKDGEPRVAPMVQSTTYRYDTTQSVADLFDLKREGFFYSRLANPTVDVMEKKIAALEGGVAAVALSSGQTANTLAIMNIAKAGDMEIVFAEEDLSSEITKELRDLYFDSDMTVTDVDSADDCILENKPNTLVSYVVAPSDGRIGSYCYKMLIDAQTYQLYYFRRHKISKKFGPGFLAEDIKRINSYRSRK